MQNFVRGIGWTAMLQSGVQEGLGLRLTGLDEQANFSVVTD